MIRPYLRHIPKSKRPRAVRFVLSRGLFFCDAPHLQPSNQKLFSLIRQTSTAASKKVPPMGRTPSTTHRWHFCRALYLQPSNQKLIFADKAASAIMKLRSVVRLRMIAHFINSLSSLNSLDSLSVTHLCSLYKLPMASSTMPTRIRARSIALLRRLRSPNKSAPQKKVTMTDERRIIDTTAIIAPSLSSAL